MAKEKTTKRGPELGSTGLGSINGVMSNDYNPALDGARGFRIYEEMRKSDGTVRSLLLACTLPVRRAKWYVTGGDDDTREFVKKNLFDLMTVTWDDTVRQALLCLVFGVAPFEKVFDVAVVNGVERVILRKLAYRHPASIEKWEMADGGNGVMQRTNDGRQAVSIPIEKLVIFVNEKEGDNWLGTSILRAPYKHWFIKNTFYKIDAIAYERQGLGIPYAKEGESGWKSDTEAKAERILQNLFAHEQSYILEPRDVEFGFKDMKGGTLRDPMPSIEHHNREIMKSMLAQFLELGVAAGSRSLSEDQSELFLKAIESIANNVRDNFNKYVIPQLVDLNFENVEDYPTLEYTGVSKINVESLTAAYKALTETGAVAPIEKDERHFREALDLPERTEEDTDIELVREDAPDVMNNPDEENN